MARPSAFWPIPVVGGFRAARSAGITTMHHTEAELDADVTRFFVPLLRDKKMDLRIKRRIFRSAS
jgi:hypothetical protein